MTIKTAGAVVALTGAALAAAPDPSQAAVRSVIIRDMAYGPLPSHLHVGDVIEWENQDIFRHSATAQNKSFDIDLPPKAHARSVLRSVGTVQFYCRFHPGMRGQFVVVK